MKGIKRRGVLCAMSWLEELKGRREKD